MTKKKNKEITNIELLDSINRSFSKVEKKMVTKDDIKKLENDVAELKESNKKIRKDILNLGDRFVSYHTFDALARRVKFLEEKK